MNYKISVIIPVYNADKHLKECLDSITNQTLKEIEIICVNDGSTDKSKDIIKYFATKNDNIKYLEMKKNSGSGPARNKGLKHSKGEYISFVDSDDVLIDIDSYKKLYDLASKKKANIVSANLKSINHNGVFIKSQFSRDIKEDAQILPQKYGIPWYHMKNLYNRQFLENNKIMYPNYKRGQDPVFLIKVLVNVDCVYCIPIDFYGYRSKTADQKRINSEEKELDYIKHFRDVLEILEVSGFEEMYIEYEKKMYDFFENHNSYFSLDSLERNIKLVFGENSNVFTRYKLKLTLITNEKLRNENIKLKKQLLKKNNQITEYLTTKGYLRYKSRNIAIRIKKFI